MRMEPTMLMVLPGAKVAVLATAKGFWTLMFSAPDVPTVSALTVCEAAVTSSTPPVT